MMPIREGCNLGFSHDFLKRQMTWTRTYHPNWAPVFIHAILTTGIQLSALGLAIWALISSNWELAGWAGGGLLGYIAAMLFLVGVLEMGVRKSLHQRGESTAWLTAAVWWKLPLAIPLTQMVHTWAVMLATF